MPRSGLLSFVGAKGIVFKSARKLWAAWPGLWNLEMRSSMGYGTIADRRFSNFQNPDKLLPKNEHITSAASTIATGFQDEE